MSFRSSMVELQGGCVVHGEGVLSAATLGSGKAREIHRQLPADGAQKLAGNGTAHRCWMRRAMNLRGPCVGVRPLLVAWL